MRTKKTKKNSVPFFRTKTGLNLNKVLAWTTRGIASVHKKASNKAQNPDMYEYQKLLDEMIDACCDAELIDSKDPRAKRIVNKLAKLHLQTDAFLTRQKTLPIEDVARFSAFQKDIARYIEDLRPIESEIGNLVNQLTTTLEQLGSEASLGEK